MVGAPTPIVNYVHFSGKGYNNIPTERSEYLIQFNDFSRTIRSAEMPITPTEMRVVGLEGSLLGPGWIF
jgi:hypothetical protein